MISRKATFNMLEAISGRNSGTKATLTPMNTTLNFPDVCPTNMRGREKSSHLIARVEPNINQWLWLTVASLRMKTLMKCGVAMIFGEKS
jgi:hypothetical protein